MDLIIAAGIGFLMCLIPFIAGFLIGRVYPARKDDKSIVRKAIKECCKHQN